MNDLKRELQISVIIPLYNKEEFIESTINSILNQTFQPFELIVVDDGSTDKSLSIVNKIASQKIKIFTKSNSGVSDTRNYGIQKAKGNWISFIDADDIWDSNYLAKVAEMIQYYTQASIIGVNYGITNHVEKEGIQEEGYLENYFEHSLKKYPFNSSSVTIKKDCFNHVGGFRPDLKEGEDLEMWYRLVKRYKIAYTPEVLSIYRKNNSVQLNRQQTIGVENYWAYHIKLVNLSNIHERTYLYKRIISLCKILIKNKRRTDLMKMIKKHGLLNILRAFMSTILNKISH